MVPRKGIGLVLDKQNSEILNFCKSKFLFLQIVRVTNEWNLCRNADGCDDGAVWDDRLLDAEAIDGGWNHARGRPERKFSFILLKIGLVSI